MSEMIRKDQFRVGKWTDEEEAYAEALIEGFKKGSLGDDVEEGTSLRTYLSVKLRCNCKRVSKKYEGTHYNGKQPYIKDKTLSEATLAAAIQETKELEEDFEKSVSTLERAREKRKKAALSRAAAAARRSEHQEERRRSARAQALLDTSTDSSLFARSSLLASQSANMNLLAESLMARQQIQAALPWPEPSWAQSELSNQSHQTLIQRLSQERLVQGFHPRLSTSSSTLPQSLASGYRAAGVAAASGISVTALDNHAIPGASSGLPRLGQLSSTPSLNALPLTTALARPGSSTLPIPPSLSRAGSSHGVALSSSTARSSLTNPDLSSLLSLQPARASEQRQLEDVRRQLLSEASLGLPVPTTLSRAGSSTFPNPPSLSRAGSSHGATLPSSSTRSSFKNPDLSSLLSLQVGRTSEHREHHEVASHLLSHAGESGIRFLSAASTQSPLSELALQQIVEAPGVMGKRSKNLSASSSRATDKSDDTANNLVLSAVTNANRGPHPAGLQQQGTIPQAQQIAIPAARWPAAAAPPSHAPSGIDHALREALALGIGFKPAGNQLEQQDQRASFVFDHLRRTREEQDEPSNPLQAKKPRFL